MRPSKLRLPLSTDATTRSPWSTALAIASGSGPELPMHVMQPYPVVWNPSWSRYSVSPAWLKYSVTTRLPGESDVFTYGGTFSPRSTAFFASKPAAIITLRSEEHTSELQSRQYLVCRLLLEKKKKQKHHYRR